MDPNQDIFNFVFLRHAESKGNAEGFYQGHADTPLTETGREQAKALGDWWQVQGKQFDLCIASPLARARTTAVIIAGGLGVPIVFDPLWMERDVGAFSGLNRDEAQSLGSEAWPENPYAPFGLEGEGQWQLFLRAGQALQNLLRRKPGHYLIVSHGGLLNMVLYAALGIVPQTNRAGPRFHFRNTTFASLMYFPQTHQWHLTGINDQRHWEPPQR